MAHLKGKIVLVTGGSGVVGGGAIRAFLRHHATVIAPTRNVEALQKLKSEAGEDGEHLYIIEADVGSEEGANKVAAVIREKHQHLDHVVSSIGSWWQKGPVADQSLAEFDTVLHNLLTPHFVAAKTFLPLVADREGSTYTFITGVSGERVIAPGTGLLTVAIAGLFSLIKVLQGEWKEKAVRINELRIGLRVVPDAQADPSQWAYGNSDIGRVIAGLSQPSELKGETIRCDPAALKDLLEKYGMHHPHNK